MNEIWDRDYTDWQRFKIDQVTSGKCTGMFTKCIVTIFRIMQLQLLVKALTGGLR